MKFISRIRETFFCGMVVWPISIIAAKTFMTGVVTFSPNVKSVKEKDLNVDITCIKQKAISNIKVISIQIVESKERKSFSSDV